MFCIREIDNINEIVKLPFNSKIIVYGVPGTGKTECVIQRIKHLIEEYEIDPISELLVLSFTRNAVSEVKNRVLANLTKYHQDINILTFDKFAWRLLSNTHVSGYAHAVDYKKNIQMATNLLKNNQLRDATSITHNIDNWPVLMRLKCVILDEVQDVNSYRAEFTYEIFDYIRRVHGEEMHFMLLGDLNQELFAYQTRELQNIKYRTPVQFLDAIKERFDVESYEINIDFEHNRRFKKLPASVKEVLEHATKLISTHYFTRNLFRSQINEFLPHTEEISTSSEFLDVISSNIKEKEITSLLFRRNEKARAVSLLLFKNNISHQYLISREANLYPPWLARCCYEISNFFKEKEEDYYISREDFINIWNEDFISRSKFNPRDAWVFFNYLATGVLKNPIELNYSNLLRNLRANFDERKLVEYGSIQSNLIVTNFHRAKGREYDNVLINEFEYPDNYKDDLIEEARTMYVGITRSKKTCQIFKYKPKKYRPFSKEEFTPLNIERSFTIFEDKYIPEDPFSFLVDDFRAAEERQKNIWEKVKIGNPIDIRMYERDDRTGEIIYGEKIIGNISKNFNMKLKYWLRKNYESAKQLLKGGYITSVYSHPPELNPRIANRLPIPFKYIKTWLGVKILGVLYVADLDKK